VRASSSLDTVPLPVKLVSEMDEAGVEVDVLPCQPENLTKA
jgi:hypothetical protein